MAETVSAPDVKPQVSGGHQPAVQPSESGFGVPQFPDSNHHPIQVQVQVRSSHLEDDSFLNRDEQRCTDGTSNDDSHEAEHDPDVDQPIDIQHNSDTTGDEKEYVQSADPNIAYAENSNSRPVETVDFSAEQANVSRVNEDVVEYNTSNFPEPLSSNSVGVSAAMSAAASVAAAVAAATAEGEVAPYLQTSPSDQRPLPSVENAQPVLSGLSPEPACSPFMAPVPSRVRRTRERYHPSSAQLRVLVSKFEQNPNPPATALKDICAITGMPLANLVLWFKNRRARNRRTAPSISKAGRRSYVKSGIYSRSLHRNGLASKSISAHNPHNVTTTVCETQNQQIDYYKSPKSYTNYGVGIGEENKHASENDYGTPFKRARYRGLKEVLGEENPCHEWDSDDCRRICMEFFKKKSGGACVEQHKLAESVCMAFFVEEVQNGLTLSSAMQPLEMSVEVLDNIMEQTSGRERSRLSSGSRVLLREFLAQVRSGRAMGFATNWAGLCSDSPEALQSAVIKPDAEVGTCLSAELVSEETSNVDDVPSHDIPHQPVEDTGVEERHHLDSPRMHAEL